MKKLYWLSVLLLILVFTVPKIVLAEESAQAADYHLKMADSYEQKAHEQDAVIAEHSNMPAEYKKKFFINEKVTPIRRIQEMEKHCEAITQEANELREDYLSFAKWHKMQAAELRGK